MYRDSSGTMPISLSSQLLWFLNQRVPQLGEGIDTHAYRMPVRKAGIFSRSLRSIAQMIDHAIMDKTMLIRK